PRARGVDHELPAAGEPGPAVSRRRTRVLHAGAGTDEARSLLVGLFAGGELVGSDVLEEGAELRDFLLERLVADLLALELDRRFVDHLVGHEDRRLGSNG